MVLFVLALLTNADPHNLRHGMLLTKIQPDLFTPCGMSITAHLALFPSAPVILDANLSINWGLTLSLIIIEMWFSLIQPQ